MTTRTIVLNPSSQRRSGTVSPLRKVKLASDAEIDIVYELTVDWDKSYDSSYIKSDETSEERSQRITRSMAIIDKFAQDHPGKPVSGLLYELFAELRLDKSSTVEPTNTMLPPPEKAPALWRTDRTAGQTPPDFIRLHYAPWVNRGLARADLRRLDEGLYFALAHWLRKNEMPADLDLPTVQERNDRWVAQVLNDPASMPDLGSAEARRFAAALANRITKPAAHKA